MPTKRNRKDSESSTCSANGILEDSTGNLESSNSGARSTGSGDSASGDMDMAYLRPCCTPIGCLLGGQVNLAEPDEIGKIVCSSESCTIGPYMHKECFVRWEDGLLTYLRSHGRARSWSEKQRRQNLWTKRGYDLAYRACACQCGRGHLRKDLDWNPQDIALPIDKKSSADEAGKKKNRKKHKDLPTLGNKYSFGGARSKSKAIPNGKENAGAAIRVRTSSTSSVLSVDQGYSSSSPSNSEIHGGFGSFFSPPQHSRNHFPPNARMHTGFRNGNIHHGIGNPFSTHATLPEIPDNDVLQDFYGKISQSSISDAAQSPLFPPEINTALPMKSPVSPCHTDPAKLIDPNFGFGNLNPPFQQSQSFQDQRLEEISKMMFTMGIAKQQSQPLNGNRPCSLPDNIFNYELPTANVLQDLQSPSDVFVANPPPRANNEPFIGHWNPQDHLPNSHSALPPRKDDKFCYCGHDDKIQESNVLLPFQDFAENTSAMLCSDIDLKKPKVIIIPGERDGSMRSTSCTEICITPMCNTVFNKRYDFSTFQSVLRKQQVNPYHIKMEGEGYGSDDFRNSVLSKLSRAKCSQMNCVTCGRDLLIYDHFPLLDGTLFLSPLKNTDRNKNELKIEVENKCEYLHAVCMWCLTGANNMVCRMCESKWNGSFHQLGSLYMYDVFASVPCCQSRLCCKRCGVAIVDRHAGLKYYSEYSKKMTCPSCGAADYHFVHPASTYKVGGPNEFNFF